MRFKLESKVNLEELLDYYAQQIKWIQHERLIHLMITLFTGSLFLIFAVAMLILKSVVIDILFITFTTLTVFYVIHYIRLENSVQRWYVLYDKLYDDSSKG